MGYKLLFSIVNQELIREDNVFLINKTQKYVEAEFTFKTPEWDNLEKFAVFTIKEKSYTIPLGSYKICTITVPREALRTTNFRISVFGGNTITTNSVKILLGESGLTHKVVPTGMREPEDIFQVIRRKLSQKFDSIEFKENNMICYSDGEIVSIVPITVSLFENYYTKEGIDDTLNELETRTNERINDLEVSLESQISDLDSITEEKLKQTLTDVTIESNENTVYLKLIKYGEDING